MKYISTRDNYKQVSAAEAIRLGMVPSGGLFVPENIPVFTQDKINDMKEMSYLDIACEVLQKYLTDYSKPEIKEAVETSYNQHNFSVEDIAPITKLDENTFILELWHGPTAAFKDMALQLMPHLLVNAIKKANTEREIVILVATSGDTGKAALEGFKDVDGIKIIVFYPEEGVSEVQKTQMVTTEGNNTTVVAVNGNFDDCQNAVKEIFGDKDLNKYLIKNNYQFSSANSINWGRLVPQLVYYFTTYAYLLRDEEIEPGKKINITVPTGNFGNILAGYYAYRMGLPVNRFICASNSNKILTDFLKTGVYDLNRDFNKTISPSMDILISSNLERFLFEITDHNAEKVNRWYRDLQEKDRFEIDKDTKEKIDQIFIGEFATEEETMEAIRRTYDTYDYVVDPHTAVGIKAYNKYCTKFDDKSITIIDSTANPYKFSRAVLDALQCEVTTGNEFDVLDELKELTGIEIHAGLKDLDQRDIRHHRSCESTEIKKEIKDILGI